MNNYIYKITDKVTGQFYIGSQCRDKIIGINYFTSSHNKEFKSKFKSNPEKFDIKIIGRFTDSDSCILQENIFIKNNFENPLCLNKAYCICSKNQFTTKGVTSPNKGKHLSKETRRKIAEANKKRFYSKETRRKIAETSKDRNNKKVICIETQIIYKSITEAGNKNNINPTYIGSCANYRLKSVGGYHWSFYDESQKEKYTLENILKIIDEKIPNKLKKKVICKETQIIYNSTTEAANAVGVFPSNITNCAKNKRRSAGGYHWEYVK